AVGQDQIPVGDRDPRHPAGVVRIADVKGIGLPSLPLLGQLRGRRRSETHRQTLARRTLGSVEAVRRRAPSRQPISCSLRWSQLYPGGPGVPQCGILILQGRRTGVMAFDSILWDLDD